MSVWRWLVAPLTLAITGLAVMASGAVAAPWQLAAAPLRANANADPVAVVLDINGPAPGSCAAVGHVALSDGRAAATAATESGGVCGTAISVVLPPDANPAQPSHLVSVSCTAAS